MTICRVYCMNTEEIKSCEADLTQDVKTLRERLPCTFTLEIRSIGHTQSMRVERECQSEIE